VEFTTVQYNFMAYLTMQSVTQTGYSDGHSLVSLSCSINIQE